MTQRPPWSAVFRGMHVLRDAGMSSEQIYRCLKVEVLTVSTDENGDAVIPDARQARQGQPPGLISNVAKAVGA